MGEMMSMSRRDLDRLKILEKVKDKELKQVEAGRLLRISDRQVRTLVHRLKHEGPNGIVSRLVGRVGNRNKPVSFKERVIALLREKYEGFGPTLAAEKLFELEGLKISEETVRLWMIEHRLWVPRKIKCNIHPPRLRRPCFGELVQADGSPHHWFGPDYPEANATVLIDDATSMITGLYFSNTETLEGYFQGLEQHLSQYGRPLALYTDHTTIFHCAKGTEKTQAHRALDKLGIELILASTPQAKGRVERVNRTLQDRLVKEFRLRGIHTIEQANAYAVEFVKKHNENFSKKPMSACDAHRSLEGYDLERILCRREERSLNSSAIFQFNKVHYQIQGIFEYRRLNKQKVEIRITRAGKMRVFLKDKEVPVLSLCEVLEQPIELNRKEVLKWAPTASRGHKPGPKHPWRQRHDRQTKNMEPVVQ